MCFRNLQNRDPFEGIQQEKVCWEEIPGLSMDYDDYYEDVNSIVD